MSHKPHFLPARAVNNARRRRKTRVSRPEVDHFCETVCHDLRTPLAAISGFSELLLQSCGTRLSQAETRYLSNIHNTSLLMGSLIGTFLNLSRVSGMEVEKRTVNLSAMSQEIVADLRFQNPGRTVNVRIEEALSVMGDPQLLRIVLQNLLGNAWKFSEKTKAAYIEVGRIKDSDSFVCFIRDNGVGFDSALYSRLFTPFQRLHSESEFAGSGIGLATVARVMSRLGGRIWAESEPGRGATFYFSLPHDAGTAGTGSI